MPLCLISGFLFENQSPDDTEENLKHLFLEFPGQNEHQVIPGVRFYLFFI